VGRGQKEALDIIWGDSSVEIHGLWKKARPRQHKSTMTSSPVSSCVALCKISLRGAQNQAACAELGSFARGSQRLACRPSANH